ICGLFYLFIIRYYYYYSTTLSSTHIFRIYSACTFSSIMHLFIPFGWFYMLDSIYVVSVVRWLFGRGGGIVALENPRWVGSDVCQMCLWFGVIPVHRWIGRLVFGVFCAKIHFR
ncbi:hypothetical protein GIB67_014284, partial [Kingdonia uniflora]